MILKSKVYYKKVLFRLIVFIIPVSILIYNYTASKLYTYQPSSIASITILFLLLYPFYLCIQERKVFQYRETKHLLAFFVFSIPAYFLSHFFSLESYVRYFSLIFFVPLGFMSGFYWAIRFNSIESTKRGGFLTILMIPAIIAAFMIVNSTVFSRFNDDAKRDYVFGVVLFLPILLYYKKILWPVVFLTIDAYICIMSLKRTGMLCVTSIIPFLYFIRLDVKKRGVYRFVTTILISFLVAFLTFNYLPDITSQFENSIERFSNMDDESNEERWGKYTFVLTEMEQANILTILFGHGCYASVNNIGTPIHNDLLEIAFDYGMIPLFFILVFFFSLLIRGVKSIKVDLSSSMILLSTLVIFLITTMGNCMFTNHIDVFVLMFTLGFALSNLIIHCD